MRYYLFRHDVDSEETGSTYPQIIYTNPKKLNPDPVRLANKAIFGTYPPEDLSFDYLNLNKGAKLTDLMSGPLSQNGFIVSKKLKLIFEEFDIKDYRFYDIKLFDNEKEIKDYYYFHSASSLQNFVDYQKSTFYIGNIINEYIRDLEFVPDSYEQLESFQKKSPYGEERISVKQIYLNNNFPFSRDLFKLNAYNYDFFISPRLAEKIEKYNITGVNMRVLNNFIKTPPLA